jgi:carboxymethylenebutenolidase
LPIETAMHTRPATLHFALLAPLLAALACSGTETSGSGDPASSVANASTQGIPVNPTPAGVLPAAVLGTAPAPLGESVAYASGDPEARGYLAIPQGTGPFPAVILIHEWNGLVDRVRQVADALAAEGYVALAADLFQGRVGSSPDENMALVGEAQANPERMIANLNEAVRFLRARPDVTGRVGAMGWCFGGGVALSFGLDGEEHEATAIFYGRLVDDPARLAALPHEVHGTFGRLDRGPSPEQVDAFAAALREAGVPNDLHIYDEVGHGFWLHVDQDPEVRTAPAADAWDRLRAYFARTLR